MAASEQWTDALVLMAFIAVVLLCCYLFTGCGPTNAEIQHFKVEASANVAALQSRIETGAITIPVSYKGVGFWNLGLILGFLYAMKAIPSKVFRAAIRPDKIVRAVIEKPNGR